MPPYLPISCSGPVPTLPIQADEATSRHAKFKASRAIYLATDAPSAEGLLTLRQKLLVPQVGEDGSDRATRGTTASSRRRRSRWHHCERGFFREDVPEDQLWGLLNIRITIPHGGEHGRPKKLDDFVLVRYQHEELVHILHSERRDIVITMRDSSGWAWEDVHFLFQDELSRREGDERVHVSRIDAEGRTVWLMARIDSESGLTIQVDTG